MEDTNEITINTIKITKTTIITALTIIAAIISFNYIYGLWLLAASITVLSFYALRNTENNLILEINLQANKPIVRKNIPVDIKINTCREAVVILGDYYKMHNLPNNTEKQAAFIVCQGQLHKFARENNELF